MDCPDCKGRREVETGIGMLPCDTCNGRGQVSPTCKTCKWWRKRRAPLITGICDKTTHGGIPPEQTFEVDADADDDSGLDAWLVTGPDFGCVHHTPADNK